MTTKNNCFFCVHDSTTTGSKLTKIPIGFGAGSSSTSLIDDELEATQGFHLFCHLLSINPRPLAHVLKNKCLWACEACAAQLASLRNFVGVYNKVKLEIDHCVSKIRGDICHKLSVEPEGEEETDEIALNSFRKEFGIEDDDSGEINWNLLSKDAQLGQHLYPVVNFLSTVTTTIVKEEPMEPAEPFSPGAATFFPQSPMLYGNPKFEDAGDDGETMEQDEAEAEGENLPRKSTRFSTRSRAGGARAAPKKKKKRYYGTQPKTCGECGKTFTRKTGLNSHLRNIHGIGGPPDERKFKCDECGKAFVKAHNLRDHSQIHTGDRFFGCQFCDKKFRTQSSRRSHEQTQHGPNGEILKKEIISKAKPQDPVKCSQCPLVFRNEPQRKRHELLIHQKKEFYTCDQCIIANAQDPPAQFKSIYNLWKHQKAEHMGKGKWTCEFCGPTGKTFYSYGKMQLHMKARHEIEEADEEKDNPGNSDNGLTEEMEIGQTLDFSDLQKLELETKIPENEPSTSTSSSISRRPQRKSAQRMPVQTSSNTGSGSETDPDGASGTDNDHDDDYNEEEEKSDPDFAKPIKRKSMLKTKTDTGADTTGEKLVYTPNRRGRRPATPLAPGEKSKRKYPERNVPCPECPKLFRYNSSLQQHHNNIHARGYIQCEIAHCDRGFPNQEALDKHMLRHALNSHKKSLIDSGIPKPRRKLPRPELLPPEPRARKNPPPPLKLKCDYCDKMFGFRCDKVRHENWVHKCIKSYLCESCGKAFKRSFQLSHHMRNEHNEHGDQGPVECDQCPPGGKKYSNVGWLEIHLRKYHGKEPPPPKHRYYYV